jgi:hypothetical protein
MAPFGESIRQIATMRFGRRHLELLRQRMAEYRARNRGPVGDAVLHGGVRRTTASRPDRRSTGEIT